MRKKLLTMAAFFCCAVATATFFSCGSDDDNTGGGTSAKAAYWTISITRTYNHAKVSAERKAQAEQDQTGYVTATAKSATTSEILTNDKEYTYKSTKIATPDSVIVTETVPDTEFSNDKMIVGAFYEYTIYSYDAAGNKLAEDTYKDFGNVLPIAKNRIHNDYYPYTYKFFITVSEDGKIDSSHSRMHYSKDKKK